MRTTAHRPVTPTETIRTLDLSTRAAFTPREFAELFGRKRGWAYRLIADGRVSVIAPTGRIMIPAVEISHLLAAK